MGSCVCAHSNKQLFKNIPHVSRALMGVLQSISDPDGGSALLAHVGKKRRKLNDASALNIDIPEEEQLSDA